MTTILTAKVTGMQAVPVSCECSITPGIGIHLVGLADEAVKQGLLRIVTAIQSLGYQIPGEKIVINLTPAGIRKEGSIYDLSILTAILAESGQAKAVNLESYLVCGEVTLDGKVRPVTGTIQAAELASQKNLACILPEENARVAYKYFGHSCIIYGVKTVSEALDILSGKPFPTTSEREGYSPLRIKTPQASTWDSLSGNPAAIRALEIAAAGGHNVIMVGSPGSEKTALAQALRELLPPMDAIQATETAKIHCLTGYPENPSEPLPRPFRAPHPSASICALFGGGSGDSIRPGEVTLAHNGVLFLNDFNEFPKAAIEALRGPMEDGCIKISRLRSITEFPTRFQLVAAINPCPCGYYGEGDRCTCTKSQREAFLSRIYGPVYDRIDIQIFTRPAIGDNTVKPEDIKTVRERAIKARKAQEERFGDSRMLNADMLSTDIQKYCKFDNEVLELLEKLIDRLGLSSRAYSRILKISRTIADIEGSRDIKPEHVAEAVGYRFLDRTQND